nr:hypothetical protein [Nocardioides convexus]
MPTVVALRLPARWRRTGVVVGLLALLAVLLLSHRFGRAVPTNNYRPMITTDAIATGCYPLPGDARLDLPYQIRRDEDVATATGQRRSLQGQYDLVDRDEAEQRLVSSFEAVGFRPTGGTGGEITLTKGAERIGLVVKEPSRHQRRDPGPGDLRARPARRRACQGRSGLRVPVLHQALGRAAGGEEVTRLLALRPAWLPRPEILLGWLVVAHVVLKAADLPAGHACRAGGRRVGVPQRGGGRCPTWSATSSPSTAPTAPSLDRNVVASGWFMPGMPVLTAPLYLVFPDASIEPGPRLPRPRHAHPVRGRAALGRPPDRSRLGLRRGGLPGADPQPTSSSRTARGGTSAPAWSWCCCSSTWSSLLRGVRRGEAPSLREGLVLGLLAIAVLYLRSSTAILLGALGAVTLLAAVLLLRGRVRLRALGSAVLAGVVFLLLLAPWSFFASQALGGRVITTTTVPTVMATTFGDRSEICFGKCDPDSTMWFRPLRYSREVGRATDTSEVEVLKVMSDYALRDLTLSHYLDQVVHNVGAYALQPNNFTGYLAPPEGRGALGRSAEMVADILTWAMYAPMILLGAVSLLFQARRSIEARVLDLLTKARPRRAARPALRAHRRRALLDHRRAGLRDRGLLLPARAPAAAGHGTPPPTGVVTATDASVLRWLGRVQVLLSVATAAVVLVLLAAIVF